MRFNNKNVILPEPIVIPFSQLPFGMKVYDGDIDVSFEYSYNTTVIYYSINSTNNWNILGNQTISLSNGSTIYFYGPLNLALNDGGSTRGFHLSGTGKVDLIGNLLSLINPDWTNSIGFNNNISSMFRLCANNLYNAKDMYIRLSVIGGYEAALGYMFLDCAHLLTSANWICDNNQLPISSSAAFIGMYARCTALTSSTLPPIIGNPIRTFERFYDGCTSLNTIYYNGTAKLQYTNFTRNVAASGDFYNLNGATYATGTSGIPSGWTEHTSL